MISRSTDIRSALRSRQRGMLLNPYRFGGAPVNPNIAFLNALYHFEGADLATTTSDSSPAARPITLAGGAFISTAQAKFGTSSMRVSGADPDNYAFMNASAAFDVGVADFTIRFWVYKLSTVNTYSRLFQMGLGDVVTGVSLADNRAGTGGLSWSISTNGSSQNILSDSTTADGTFPNTTWTHFSIEQYTSGGSNRIALYKQGTRISDVSMGNVKPYYNATYPWTWGGQTGTNRSMNAYFDEFEYYKGVALAGGAASYVVPTAPSLP